jgi:nicotinate dehydrogenase subunit A
MAAHRENFGRKGRSIDCQCPAGTTYFMPIYTCSVNGAPLSYDGQPNDKLLFALHEHGLTAAKLGCGAAQCGACVVWVNGQAQAACDFSMWLFEHQYDSPSVLTLEGLMQAEPMIAQALLNAFEQHQAAQCGYCSAGILMKAAALIKAVAVDESSIHRALDGHLCRCGSHHRIVRAILQAAQDVSLLSAQA